MSIYARLVSVVIAASLMILSASLAGQTSTESPVCRQYRFWTWAAQERIDNMERVCANELTGAMN